MTKMVISSTSMPQTNFRLFLLFCKHHFIALTFSCSLHVVKNQFHFYLCHNICQKSVFWHRVKNDYGGCTWAGSLSSATCLGSIWEKIKGGSVPGETLPDIPSGERKSENLHGWAVNDFPLGGRQTPGKKFPGNRAAGGALALKSNESPSSLDHILYQEAVLWYNICCSWAVYSSKKFITKNPPQLPLQRNGTNIPAQRSKMKFCKSLAFLGLQSITILLAYKLRFYSLKIYSVVQELLEARMPLLNRTY